MKERYHITGMTCSACSSHVQKSVGKLGGVEKASVNLLTETMEVLYDEQALSGSDIVAAVERAGYGAQSMGGAGRRTGAGGKGAMPEGGAPGTGAGPGGQSKGGEAVAQSPGCAIQEPDTEECFRGLAVNKSSRGHEEINRRAAAEAREMKWRLGISIGFLIPLMYVAMYHMFNDWFGLPIPGFIMDAFHGNENAMNFALTQFLLLLPVLYMNRKFFTVGFRTLRHLSPNMDSLIALGASAAVLYGLFAMYRISYGLGHGDMGIVAQYSHDLYFESAGMILTLITVGKYLESRSKGRTSEAITKLMDLSPKTAIVLDANGEEKEIPTEMLSAGQLFLVKPGSLVPADGTVVEGNSSIDEAAITGESVPVEKREGDQVVSATMNKSGFLKCRADRVGEDTTLSQIIRLVEEASASKAPIAQLADKVAGIFVPVVIVIALVTLAGWLLAGAGMEFAISTAIAVLVISCPCALGLATPVAIMVGTGVGAGHGILIKSGEALQQAREVDTVVLDKTGTITEGKLKVMQAACMSRELSREQLLVLAASLEKQSEHPLAEAVVAAAQEANNGTGPDMDGGRSAGKAVGNAGTAGKAAGNAGTAGKAVGNADTAGRAVENAGVAGRAVGNAGAAEKAVKNADTAGKTVRTDRASGWPEVRNFRAVFGRGIEGELEAPWLVKGKYYIGNQAYLQENGIRISGEDQRLTDQMADEGQTPLLVADSTRVLGIIGVSDTIRDSSAEAVAAWREMGVHVIMLTGDNRRTAEAVRRRLKLEEVVAEVLPQDKEKKVSELKEKGRRVAMIGDGINDAPALAAADVGMAIGAGTDVAMESADIILMKSDLRDAVTAMRLSRAVIRNIKENLFWAFFYNSIGIPLAAGLLYPAFELKLNPMFGAAAMSLSSIFVVGNALRLKGFKSSFRKAERSEDRPDNMPIRQELSSAENNIRKEDRIMKKEMKIEGMSCGHCTARVQKALEALAGVEAVEMSLEDKSAVVTLSDYVPDETLSGAVTDAGYEVTGITEKQ